MGLGDSQGLGDWDRFPMVSHRHCKLACVDPSSFLLILFSGLLRGTQTFETRKTKRVMFGKGQKIRSLLEINIVISIL